MSIALAGIYIHIPFCRKKCYYCDFHTSVNLKNKDLLVESIISEIDLRRDYLNGEVINTIYFGGGTPSLLEKSELDKILNKIYKELMVSDNPEITLEANPDDLNKEYLKQIKNSGINRLSIGIQSFDDHKLRTMNRRHDSKHAVESVLLSQDAGFDNISIDLIYGLPDLSIHEWQAAIIQALDLKIQHISSYHLTYEPNTVFYNHLKKGKIIPLNDEAGFEQFNLLTELISIAGFEQYEISNFALPGFRSKHNSSYWKQEKYLGVGPSSHSFDGESRQWNISNNQKYIDAITDEKNYYELEYLDSTTRFNEYIMTSLRTIEGVDLDYISNEFGISILEYLNKSIESLIINNSAIRIGRFIRLTKEGLFISDKIISDLFIVD